MTLHIDSDAYFRVPMPIDYQDPIADVAIPHVFDKAYQALNDKLAAIPEDERHNYVIEQETPTVRLEQRDGQPVAVGRIRHRVRRLTDDEKEQLLLANRCYCWDLTLPYAHTLGDHQGRAGQ